MSQEVDQATKTSGSVEARLARHGKVSYMQIPAIDTERSAAFYAEVFGWRVGGDRNHRSFDDASGELIGAWVTGRAISSDPGILPYIYVVDIDEIRERIEAHSGRVVRAPYPEGDLWVATFSDPAGNVLGVWQQGPR
jgi:predicted enzyme related to lactoylglutathione lyase